ncbi:MAG TPA: outer membrane beta-barrel protein [Kofleriaceae bacterium]|nr:outer membrane beta-barrel protein [Kofleriaceae bacterium]
MRFVTGCAVAICIASSSASAQTPAADAATPTAPASPSPAPAAAAAPAPASVMANRWALSVGLGAQSLKASDDNIGFLTYELGARFRIIRPLEVALSIAAGANRADSYGGLWLDVRYNFLAERVWNVYATIGLGLASAAEKNADDNDGHTRGSFRFGAGVERRFDVFSLSAELRVLTMSSNPNADSVEFNSPDSELASDSSAGLGLVIGATYYF